MINLNGNYARTLLYHAENAGELENLYLQARALLRGERDAEEVSDTFLRLLNEVPAKSRLAVLRRFEKLARQHLGVEDVLITVARPLTDRQQERVVARFEQILGKRLMATVQVDPQLIGGMRVLADNRLFDDSVQNSLGQLGKAMKEVLVDRAG